MSQETVWIVGAGGHAKVVLRTLEESGQRVRGVLDDDPGKHGQDLLGAPIAGPIARLADDRCRAVIAIGDNDARAAIAGRFSGVTWVTAVHPRAWVDPSARLGAGTVVFAGATIQPDVVIGAHAIVNTGASIDHDGRVGDFAHVAPGVHLAGDVHVGAASLIGIGAAVVQGIRIGRGATVGAGAVVLDDVADDARVLGVPARPR